MRAGLSAIGGMLMRFSGGATLVLYYISELAEFALYFHA